MRTAGVRVGELARRTGMTVRTLHYYDEIGLLSPSDRTAAGHRLYGAGDIARLQRITSLRQLGFSLEEIGGLLSRPDISPQRVIELHVARLREQIERQRRLCGRLETLAERLRSAGDVSADEFIEVILEMSMFERYYTPEQLHQLEERRQSLGEERIREVEGEWPQLMEQVRAEMERGTDPSDEGVKVLARRWMTLVREFTGGDPEIGKALDTMSWQEATDQQREMYSYISRAVASSR